MSPKCKRSGCEKPAARTPQVYCSRDCAPFGQYSRDIAEHSEIKRIKREKKALQHRLLMEDCAAQGMTYHQAIPVVGLSLITLKVYARKWKIQFKRKKPGLP